MYSLRGQDIEAGKFRRFAMHSNMALVLDFQFCLSLKTFEDDELDNDA